MTTVATYEELAVFDGHAAAQRGDERTVPIQFQDEEEWWTMGYDHYQLHKDDKQDA